MAELSDDQKRLYARQVLLPEIGSAGQGQLCAAAFAVDPHADALAAAVATEYLTRAGASVAEQPAADARVLQLPAAERVEQLAGEPWLRDCAAWLAGSFAAVEAIKQATGAGSAGRLDERSALNAEVR